MQSSFDNKKQGSGKKPSDYDFFQGVFEWIFYNLPPKADNTFIRNMFEFYKTRGGLSIKQMQALLKTIDYIKIKPPFNPATIEAIIKKKAVKTKSAPPAPTPLYEEDIDSKKKLEKILSIAPAHKTALLYNNKLNLHQTLTASEKEDIDKFLKLLQEKKK
ncbi:MAG: hypothetical protein JSS70_17590 [Bacteroidetes bacterium]|nr:hypothetical protein [Bacteroidota bacterium]